MLSSIFFRYRKTLVISFKALIEKLGKNKITLGKFLHLYLPFSLELGLHFSVHKQGSLKERETDFPQAHF